MRRSRSKRDIIAIVGVLSAALLIGGIAVWARSTHIDADGVTLRNYDHRVIRLKGQPFGARLSGASAIVTVGHTLLVLDNADSNMFHLFATATRRELTAFGGAVRAGDSPFSGPAWFAAAPADSSGIWVYDVQSQQFARLTFVLDSGVVIPIIGRRIVINGRPVFSPVWTKDRHILAEGLFDDGRLIELDSVGRRIAMHGDVPVDGDSATPHVLQQAFRGTLVHDYRHSRFAIALRHADQIEIYDASGAKLLIAHGPFAFQPTYHIGMRGRALDIVFRGDTRYGYVAATADDHRILALFSGRTLGNARGRAIYGRFIHEFDWKGNLLRVFALDRDASAITIGPQSQTVYVVAPDENGRQRSDVIAYTLPANLRPATRSPSNDGQTH